MTPDNFDENVLNSKHLWFVEFYAPWCGHCKNLEPHWNKAATDLKGKVKIAKVNADEHKELGGRFGVGGFPTIKIFAPNSSTPEDYNGPRDAEGIVQVALSKMEQYGVKPSLDQLVSDANIESSCKSATRICVIAILPHIFETNTETRNGHIETVLEAMKSSRSNVLHFLWAQGGDFYEFEEKLGLTFGTPAVVAISFAKKKYAVMRSSFSKANLSEFLTKLLNGKQVLDNLPANLPKLPKVDEWDGKDAKPEL